MEKEQGLAEVAQLFKTLGSPLRLRLLREIEREARTVGALAPAVEVSQPLASQHLHILRHVGLVIGQRQGREMTYRIADHHLTHMVAGVVAHVRDADSA